MKSHRLFGLALIICILFITFGPCHAQLYSPEFQAFLNQIQQNYLAPKGENISALRSQYPAVMATLVGHGLRQQMVHVQQNPSLNNQFMNLQREAQVYIGEVARTTSARLDNGSRFTPQDLWNIVNRAYQGQDDGWILQNFRVQTGTMPSVLAGRPGVQAPGPPVGGPPMTREEKNQIELFGMGAPPVKGGPPKEPPPPSQIKPQPDGIVGNWTAYRANKVHLRIWKQGNVYLGSMSGEPTMDYAFKPNANDVCFQLKHVGEGKTGPKFEGEYIWWTGGRYESINNPPEYRREKMVFYYRITLDGREERLGMADDSMGGGILSFFRKR